MELQPLVSIIIPVYGVEQYVDRAIQCIQDQSYENWELFLVDDGTKDRSGDICDEYAKEDGRIRVIHKENGGAPSARNTALPLACGKYVCFFDADDWTESRMLSDMVKAAETTNAQLVVTGYYIDTYYTDTQKFIQEQSVPDVVYASKEEFHEKAYELFDQNLLYSPWNKLYRLDYIREHDLWFPHTFWDDIPFVMDYIRDVERVTVLSRPYYHFIRKREESETARYRPDMYQKREEEDGWMWDLYRHWGVDTPETREMIDRRYIERLIGCVENETNPRCEKSALRKRSAIRRMIRTDRAQQAVRGAKPHSAYMKIMLIPIKLRSPGLMFLESLVISRVKSSNTRLFAVLKAGR